MTTTSSASARWIRPGIRVLSCIQDRCGRDGDRFSTELPALDRTLPVRFEELQLVIVCSASGFPGSSLLDPLVDHRKKDDLDRACKQAADHHDRQRLLDLGSGTGRENERYKTDAADQAAQQFGSQPYTRAFDDGFA